jgi:hypothetical protein
MLCLLCNSCQGYITRPHHTRSHHEQERKTNSVAFSPQACLPACLPATCRQNLMINIYISGNLNQTPRNIRLQLSKEAPFQNLKKSGSNKNMVMGSDNTRNQVKPRWLSWQGPAATLDWTGLDCTVLWTSHWAWKQRNIPFLEPLTSSGTQVLMVARWNFKVYRLATVLFLSKLRAVEVH